MTVAHVDGTLELDDADSPEGARLPHAVHLPKGGQPGFEVDVDARSSGLRRG